MVCGLFINQSRIDEVVESHKKYNFQIISSVKKLESLAINLKIKRNDFESEFSKNGLNKKLAENLKKKTDKKWTNFALIMTQSQLFKNSKKLHLNH